MMKTFCRLMRLALLIAGSMLAHQSMAQIVIVAGAKSPITTLSRDQATALFLGKSTQLPTGNTGNLAYLADQSESAALREQFYAKLTDKSVALVKAGWARLVFSGKAARPRELANSAEVKKFVASNPDALGYIEKSAVDSSVKVVFVLE